MELMVIPGNRDGRAPMQGLTAALKGKKVADKGHISKKLFDKLRLRPAACHRYPPKSAQLFDVPL